jgi:uncharacterized membrane protein YkvA (DUF1232 family)
MMADKTVPKRKKALVIFGIIYLFLPVDLIPPVLFPFGFIDDLVLWIFILYTLKETLDTYWMGEKPVNYSKKYKDAIEQDDFEVVDEDDFEVVNEESQSANTEPGADA